MEPGTALVKLADSCKGEDWCPAVHRTDRDTLVFTGPVVDHHGLRAGPHERSVELAIDLVKEAIRALDAG